MFEPFWGLSGHPFELSPDPAFFFASRRHKRAYACLQHGLRQGEGITLLTGEAGAGKTTTVEFFLRQLDDARIVARRLDCRQINAGNLLASVATAFGAKDGRRRLLFLDEAQAMPLESLAALRPLQTVLIGRPELNALMRACGERVVASCHLGALEREETRGYIEHRLKQVGWDGTPRFDEEAFALIHCRTGGIPRYINLVCARALSGTFVAEKHPLGAEALKRVIQAV